MSSVACSFASVYLDTDDVRWMWFSSFWSCFAGIWSNCFCFSTCSAFFSRFSSFLLSIASFPFLHFLYFLCFYVFLVLFFFPMSFKSVRQKKTVVTVPELCFRLTGFRNSWFKKTHWMNKPWHRQTKQENTAAAAMKDNSRDGFGASRQKRYLIKSIASTITHTAHE